MSESRWILRLVGTFRNLAAALCLALSACTAIEIDTHPSMPVLRMQAATDTPETTAGGSVATTVLPGGVAPSAALAPTSGALNLTVEGAIVLALERNRALQVDLINPLLQQTFVSEQQAVFDPVVSADLRFARTQSDRPGAGVGVTRGNSPSIVSRNLDASLDISKFFATGTTIDLSYSTGRSTVEGVHDNFPGAARAGVTISQQLLNGFGLDVNLVSLRQARLSALASDYELRGFTEALIAQVENAYWDALLAQRQVGIFEDALKVAQKQLDETLENIRVGTLARTERFSAQTEVALRQEDLINGRSRLERASLALLRLTSPPGETLRPRPIRLLSEPILPARPTDGPEQHIALALQKRPDLNQARLSAKSDELQIVKTRNGLLPNLELFINLGKTGYADSFGGAATDIHGSRADDMSAELQYSYALGNRAARARHRRALYTHEQQRQSIANLSELVEQDVRGALIEVDRVRAQVSATAITKQLQEQTLQTEQEKLRVGRSTLLQVAQAERDLLAAQINEVQAAIDYLKAIVDLYRLDGSLLARRGILCPGEPKVEPTGTSSAERGAY